MFTRRVYPRPAGAQAEPARRGLRSELVRCARLKGRTNGKLDSTAGAGASSVACLALIVALGGSVYAAAKIDGHSVKPKSLPGNRLERASLPGNRLQPGTLRGGRIAPGR